MLAHRTDTDVVCPGVDRIVWLTVDFRDGEPYGGLVHGIRHRRPVEVAVDAEAVRRLLAAGVPARPEEVRGVYVCHCRAVTDRAVSACLADGAQTLEELVERCGAGGRCGGCRPLLVALLTEADAVVSMPARRSVAA